MKHHLSFRALLAVLVVAALVGCGPMSGPRETIITAGTSCSALVWNIAPNSPVLRYDLAAEAHGISNPDDILQANGNGGESNGFSASVRVRGILEIAGIPGPQDIRSFAIRILDGRVAVQMANGEGDVVGLADALHRWSRVSCDSSGRIVELSVPRDLPDAGDGLIRSLLGTLQLLKPPTASGAHAPWETTEDDSNGRYVAHYSMEPDSTQESLRLRKERLRYLPPPPEPGELSGAAELVPAGGLRARIHRSSGTLEALESEDHLETLLANRVVGTSRTRVTLTRVADSPRLGTAEWEQLMAEMAKHGPGRSLSAPSPEREMAMHRDQLGKWTVEELITRLSTDVAGLPSASRTDLALSLEALIRVHPEACARLEHPLTTLTEASALRLLTSAMVRAGNAEAQATLARVLQRRSSDAEALTALIPATGNLVSPSIEIERTLFELSEHSHPTIVGMSRLALGVLSRQLRAKTQERADRIAGWAARGLRDADCGGDSCEPRVIQWLHVLGNAASPGHVQLVLDYCTDRRTGIREAAHWALRFLSDPDAIKRLAMTLRNDPRNASWMRRRRGY